MSIAMTCPHCQRPNAEAGAYCEHCGKAMPTSQVYGGPRVVGAADTAQTAGGRELQAQELHKQAKKASGALLAVAIIQTILAVLIWIGLWAAREQVVERLGDESIDPNVVAIAVTVIAVILWALWLWSRNSPLPAAIVALVLLGSLWFLDFLADPRTILNGIILKVIVVVVLINAIKAGVKHRQILKEMQQHGG